mmetsp:Transcript_22380/g.69980  ORF Transcript_22380/g.69980 Transcript_22380/m.69980 type:complete len:204 (-) Transcript_22380:403-1014(-)
MMVAAHIAVVLCAAWHSPSAKQLCRAPTTLCATRMPRLAQVAMIEDADGEYARVKAMSVADIKAELELRGVDFATLFEKDELVRRLVLARAQGEADPSLVDKFNADSLERSFQNTDPSEGEGEEVDPFAVADETDMDSLPGGMSPEMVKKLASNPELMVVLKNPRMQDVLKDVMENGPVAFAKHAQDAEVREMLALFQQAMSS